MCGFLVDQRIVSYLLRGGEIYMYGQGIILALDLWSVTWFSGAPCFRGVSNLYWRMRSGVGFAKDLRSSES